MHRSWLPQVTVGIATIIAGFNLTTLAGDGCGCAYQAPCRQSCFHHRCCRCDSCPPTGVVVPSAPAAMPVQAMPYMPMQMVAAQAPTYTYALQAAPQMAPKSACGGDGSMNQLVEQAMVKALVERLGNNGNGNGSGNGNAAAPQSAPAASLDEKLAQLDRKVTELGRLTEKVSEALLSQHARIKALEGK